MKKYTILIICSCMFCLVLVSCTLPTSTALSTAELQQTTTPSATKITGEESESALTNTPTIPSITKTSPPFDQKKTMEPEEVKEKILQELKDNGGCEFPCMFGFYPGQMNAVVAKKLVLENYRRIDIDNFALDRYSDAQGFTAEFFIEEYIISMNFRYELGDYNEALKTKYIELLKFSTLQQQKKAEGGLIGVSGISYHNRIFSFYTSSSILDKYGSPDEIYIYSYYIEAPKEPYGTSFSGPEVGEYFDIGYLYMDKNLFIQYSVPADKEIPGRYCPDVGAITLWVWGDEKFSASEREKPFKESNLFNEFFPYISESYENIQLVFSISEDEYTKLILANPDFCFESN